MSCSARGWSRSLSHDCTLLPAGCVLDRSQPRYQPLQRARRPEVFGKESGAKVDVTLKCAVEEAREKLGNLGLPPLMIEGDFEDVTGPTNGSGNSGNSPGD
jgi:hypothetical protein